MPNRIIKESIRTSDSIASLSDFEFRLWVSLIVSADDAGRGDARPAIIKGQCFALRDKVTVKMVEDALHGLVTKDLISLYKVGGKPYFELPTWANHQRIRDVKPKFPSPEEADPESESAAICGNLRQSAASCGELRPESESESNPNPNPKEGGKTSRFSPPSLEEVEKYCKERQNRVDPQRFVDFYAAKGWMVGKNHMRDWKACVRTWENRDKQKKGEEKPKTSYDMDLIKQRFELGNIK